MGIACALVLTIQAARAQDEADTSLAVPAVSSSRAISTTQRFIATGSNSLDNVRLVNWAEQVAEEIVDDVGEGMFFRRWEPLHIAVRTSEEDPEGRVIRAQGFVEGRLRQKLILVNAPAVDQEDMLEGLCWLLLNRYAIRLQSKAQRARGLAEVPDWLSVGVAQNFHPALRSRNSLMVFKAWQEKKTPSFEELLALEVLPAGRWLEKAACGVALSWVMSMPSSSERFEALFGRLARGEPVSAEWFAYRVAGEDSMADLEKGLDVWIATRQFVRTDWGEVTMEQVQEIRDLSTVGPEVLSMVAEEEMPYAMTLDELIEKRGEPWVPALATFLGLRVRNLAIGQGEEIQDVVAKYGRFFDALGASRKRRAFPFRLRARGSSGKRLASLLGEAREALAYLEMQFSMPAPESEAPGVVVWQSFKEPGEGQPRVADNAR